MTEDEHQEEPATAGPAPASPEELLATASPETVALVEAIVAAKMAKAKPARRMPSLRVSPKTALTLTGVAVGVVLLVLVVVQWQRADSLSASADGRLAASQVAGTFTQDLLTYSSSDPTATLDKLKAMATAAYQPSIAKAKQAAVSGSSSSLQTSASAQVESVYLTEQSGNSATAICEATWLVTSGTQVAPPVDFYVKVGLKLVSGSWKVNSVAGIAALAAQPGGGSGGSTTTTVPSSSTTTAGG